MSSELIRLRLAEPGDAPAMLRTIHAAFGARRPVIPPAAALSDTVADIERALGQGEGVIAEIDSVMAGCLLLSIDGPLAGLHRVSVHPDHREHGIAAAMVRGAIEVATDLGARRIELLARREFPETLSWWQAHGFEQVRMVDLGHILAVGLPARVVVPTASSMHILGRRLAPLLRPGDVLVASGDLGAGKTTLTQGIGEGLDVSGPIISPTFVLSRVHPARGNGLALVHVDAYRLGSVAELEDLDLDATLGDSVTLIEWGAGLAEGLSASRLDIDIRRSSDPDDETRVVYLAGLGKRWRGIDLHSLAETE
ncbi:MAG TPA: tRNA (adenosine(37)-N6)-threonylcarbamoyltransferase complex ATPase subunit type 1 TsaE [Propionibacteriaceae bacterium]|nr:tRNA (adenosine(37)-N6)-threonylcarbamoyltransferase complex ATPase subunit type 1 TsaE [Propionibacteriaceae bacterium]